MGLNAEGLVCVKVPSTATESSRQYTIIAAAGKFESQITHSLQDLPSEELRNLISTAAKEKRKITTDNESVLFFEHKSGSNMIVYIQHGRKLNDTDQQLLQVFCSNISVCLDNIAMVSKLHHYAYYDAAFNIPNRLFFTKKIEELLLKDQQDTNVLMVDMDNFSAINDTLGTQAGDSLLSQMVERLLEKFPTPCCVARLSGDRFGLLGPADQVNVQQVKALVAAPFLLEKTYHPISVTQGYVKLSEAEGKAEEALKKANIALKKAKELYRGDSLQFTGEMAVQTENRVKLLHGLKRAFDFERLYLAYQPQICLKQNKIVGVEALMRWRNDESNMVAPDQFIPVAESSGLIVPLGEWALNTALFELTRLRKKHAIDLRMGVNVSAVQMRQDDFLEVVKRAISTHKIQPEWLELEITESTAMVDAENAIKTVLELREIGVKVAMDDFGTGYSSLSRLEKFRLSRLKIDKSFIDKIEPAGCSSQLPDMIINLGRELNLEVIAEGVEHAYQLDYLKQKGCDEIQGYLFAKPMPPEELDQWLENQT